MCTCQSALGYDADRIIKLFYFASDLYQFRNGCFQMLWNDIQYCHISFGRCCRKHKGSCFDLIRNYGIFCTVQTRNATDLDHVRSCTSDIGSHAVQEVRHVYDMRLFCHILHDRCSLSHRCRHHNIDGRTHTYYVKINMLSYQSVGFSNNLAVFNLYICSQCAEPFQMLVNRSASDIASARKCYFRTFVFSK